MTEPTQPLPDTTPEPFSWSMRGPRRRRRWRRLLVGIVILVVSSGGCSGPRQLSGDSGSGSVPPITLSPTLIHSRDGDLSARLPRGWVTLDVERLDAPEVFAMACDSNYTMSVIFSQIPSESVALGGIDRGDLRSLADLSFQRRMKRSNGRARLTQTMESFAIGRRAFAAYTFSTDSMRTLTRVAVFQTGRHAYECAITHLTFSDRALPGLRVLQGIHNQVLGSIE